MKKIIVLLLMLLFACNCAHYATPESTKYEPVAVKDSVYKLQVYDAVGMPLGSGTGFKVADDMLLTAGHVCEPFSDGASYEAEGYNGHAYHAVPLRWASDPDLCIMAAPGVPGLPLDKLVDVKYGDEVWFTGAPRGLYGANLAPFDNGWVVGPGFAVLRSGQGASGSPIYTKNGVTGVLVGTWSGTQIYKFETAAAVRQFIADSKAPGA